MVLRRISAAALAAALVAAVQLVLGAPAQAAPRVLYYDASRAQEFVAAVHQGAENWNSRVDNVRLEPAPAGRRANITVYADDGWPRAYVNSLGNGSWYMGREAVAQGHHEPRIAAHEFGHLLGLPDRRTGSCADLMSGSSAPTTCTNEYPNEREAAEVEAAFASGRPAAARTFVWSGADQDSTRIVGGQPVSQAYSFLVSLPGCTGSLITDRWAVTAEHCSTPSQVRVGSVTRGSGGTILRVVRAVSHPRIDVKLLQLESAVPYAPAPIPTSSGAVGTATRIIGWGQTCPTRDCGPMSTTANELNTSIVADGNCLNIDAPVEICTDNPGGNAGACYGDSGGPQVRQSGGSWLLIGVTSRAGNNNARCATGPSIYGDLPAIRSWINSQVGGLPA